MLLHCQRMVRGDRVALSSEAQQSSCWVNTRLDCAVVCHFWPVPLSLATILIMLHIPRYNGVLHINLAHAFLAADPHPRAKTFHFIVCPDVGYFVQRCCLQRSRCDPDFHACGYCYSCDTLTRWSERAKLWRGIFESGKQEYTALPMRNSGCYWRTTSHSGCAKCMPQLFTDLSVR